MSAQDGGPETQDGIKPGVVFVVRRAQISKHTPYVAFKMQTEIALLRDALQKIADFHHQNAEAYARTAALPAPTEGLKMHRRFAERGVALHVAAFDFVRSIAKGTQP